MCNVCRFSSPVSCQHFQRKTGRLLVGRSLGREPGGLGSFLALRPSHYMMHSSSLLCFHYFPHNSTVSDGLWAVLWVLGTIGKALVAEDIHSHPGHIQQCEFLENIDCLWKKKKNCTFFCLSEKFSSLQRILTTFPWIHVLATKVPL